jgi:DNA-binding MarR family transcriptional regulator
MSRGDARAFEDAARISGHLDAIRRVVRESIWAAARSYPVPLTPPQVLALHVLVDEVRESGGGLSLSELSRRMGLAHSTVSGIVTRLEHRGMLRRTPYPDDRRYVRIELARPVRDWVERELPAARLAPLAAALAGASEEERATVVRGLDTLERLIGRPRGREGGSTMISASSARATSGHEG